MTTKNYFLAGMSVGDLDRPLTRGLLVPLLVVAAMATLEDVAPALESDWREFRAQLLARERGG